MGSKRKQRMRKSIHKLMRQNALSKMIDNPALGESEQINESQRRFFYVELVNTKPLVAYAFNIDEPIIIGRNIDVCTIAVNDSRVSRQQCQICTDGAIVWAIDMSDNNTFEYRDGFYKENIGNGSYVELNHRSKIVVGGIQIRVYLVQGYDVVLN